MTADVAASLPPVPVMVRRARRRLRLRLAALAVVALAPAATGVWALHAADAWWLAVAVTVASGVALAGPLRRAALRAEHQLRVVATVARLATGPRLATPPAARRWTPS